MSARPEPDFDPLATLIHADPAHGTRHRPVGSQAKAVQR
jgi:hypothetical protein